VEKGFNVDFISKAELKKIFSSEETCQKLSSTSNFVVCWHSYKFSHDLETIFRDHQNLFVLTTHVNGNKSENLVCMSICSTLEFGKNNKTILSIDNYGIFSIKLFKKHLGMLLSGAFKHGIHFDSIHVVLPESQSSDEEHQLLDLLKTLFDTQTPFGINQIAVETNV
jgi:hypothetical protein